jgi:hypothetical protein
VQIHISMMTFQLLAGSLPIILYSRNFTLKYLEVFILLVSSFISTTIVFYTYLNNFNNHLIFNIYVIIEFICLSIFYKKISNPKYYFIYFLSLVVFCSISFVDYSKGSVLEQTAKFSCLTFILYSLFYFIQSIFIQSDEKDNEFRHTLCAAILFYNCSAFFLIYYLMEFTKLNLWYVHNFIEGSSKLLIAYALWKLPKTAHS